MGCRRQTRAATNLSVNLCGTDTQGRAFIERVRTANISRDGALLEGVQCALMPGDVVVLRCEQNTGRFRVIWRQPEENAKGSRLGLVRLTHASNENAEPPVCDPDEYVRPRRVVRRQFQRYKHELPGELRMREIKTPAWVTTFNLSEEGCAMQTGSHIPCGTDVGIGIWLGETKIWAQGVVVSSQYGFGTGIKFTSMSRQDRDELREYLSQSRAEISERRESKDGSCSQAHFASKKEKEVELEEFIVSVPLIVPDDSAILE